MLDALLGMFEWLWDLFLGSIVYVFDQFEALWFFAKSTIRTVGSELFNWAIGMLPPDWAGYIEDAAANAWTFTEYLDDWAWILPIHELFAIIAGTLAAAGSIRIVRWALAFVPTIGG